MKSPKVLKMPWANGVDVSSDGGAIVVAGEGGSLVRVRPDDWKIEPWPAAYSIISVAVAPDGQRIAVGAGARGSLKGEIELRDMEGRVVWRVEVSSNPRVRWSPDGATILAKLCAHVDKPYESLALVRADTGAASEIDVGPVDSVVAAFVRGGLVALARRVGADVTEAHRLLRIDEKGAVADKGPTKLRDAYRFLLRIAEDRLLLLPGNDAWKLLDGDGAVVAAGVPVKDHVLAGCVDGDGFAVALSSGKAIRRYDRDGRLRSEGTAKKRVHAMAAAGARLLLVESGTPGQLEIFE